MPPTDPNDEERLEEQAEDNQFPFQPADPNPDDAGLGNPGQVNAIPDDHPATDTNIDPHDAYDAGVSGAANVGDNSGASAVTSYTDPDADNDAEE